MAGDVTIDVGFRGAHHDAVPIFPHAIGVDLDYPGYDGKRLPFSDENVDTVYSSHMLEHVVDYRATIRDWYRVLKSGGFIVCVVPHQFLYEKKTALPSIWNSDHKRFYTPASLLREFEEALVPNTYRIRHLCDSDDGYTYDIGPDVHSGGGYEIELVVQKIKKTVWVLAGSPNDGAAADLDEFSRLIAERDKCSRESDRWFDAAVLVTAEEIFRSPAPRRSRGLRWVQHLFDRKPQVALSEARRAEAMGQWERAARFYLDVLRSDPDGAKAWQHLGDCLKATGKYLEAEFAYRQGAEHRSPER